ncbi:MAG: methylmalonyl Co-A mutase-associated GTPase MeaB [Egibacteraceae bacterium]
MTVVPGLADDKRGAGTALTEQVRRGHPQAIARMLTLVERRSPGVDEMLAELHDTDNRAYVIGVTGPAGSGKSTLVARIAEEYLRRGRTVGIIAVDPSSGFSGGAILGDRIRMGSMAGDDRVFIRSMATRGALGGLARATLDGVAVLDAAGKDIVILETVGVGQAEVDVVSAAHTVAVVSVPGLGDGVQAIKAGLLEIADVHVVNKSDREGAHMVFADLREMLRLAPHRTGQWRVPIQQTVASTGDGVAPLVDVFEQHLAWLAETAELDRRDRRNVAARIRWAAEELVANWLSEREPAFARAVDDVTARRDNAITAAARLVRDLQPSLPGTDQRGSTGPPGT